MQSIRIFNRLKYTSRYFSKDVCYHNRIYLENLSVQRSLLRLSGNEVFGFLQGLITNDIAHLKTSPTDCAIYTMFLNKQGRVLYDTIIYKYRNDDSTVLIECDQTIQNELKQHLTSFQVRKRISIDIMDHNLNVWASFTDSRKYSGGLLESIAPTKLKRSRLGEKILACFDPRLNELGLRLVTPSRFNIENFQSLDANVEFVLSEQQYNYVEHRYIHGISEGIQEIPIAKAFPFEANCDYLHGISFHKGCYLGQELTARTYHTGVIRKRIMPIVISSPDMNIGYDSQILNENGLLIGKVRGIQKTHAIGSLKIEPALCSKYLKIGKIYVSTFRPTWWPATKTSSVKTFLCNNCSTIL